MRFPMVMRLAPLALLLAFVPGCLQSDRNAAEDAGLAAEVAGESWVEAWDSLAPPAVPTLDDLQAALGLTEEQSPVVAEALATWQSAMEAHRAAMQERRGEGRGGATGGHGVPGGFGEHEPPMLAFLETVAPVLDSNQVASLANLLETRCNERPDGRRGGYGQGGRHGAGRGPGRHGRGPGLFLGRLVHELEGVTDEQRTQIHEALAGKRQEFFELRQAFAEGTISAEELRDEAKALRESIESALQSILTAEQYEALEALVAEHRAELAQRRLDRLEEGVARRLEFLSNVLTLTDDQRAQVSAILEQSVAARRAVLEALRDGTIEIEDALYEGYVIAQDTAGAIRALLTPEQQVIFDSLRRVLPGHRGPCGP